MHSSSGNLYVFRFQPVLEAMTRAIDPIPFKDLPLSLESTAVILVAHVGAVAALFVPTVSGFVALVVLYLLSGIGVTVGYHRMLTHNSFQARKWVARTLTTLGSLALEGDPANWVAIHRLHHAHSDTDFDPHNAQRGFIHSHIRWITRKLPDEFLGVRYSHLARDVFSDPYYRWLSRYQLVPNLFVGAALYAIGGFPVLLWGVFLRIVLVYHATWLVNSLAHYSGQKSFENAPGYNNLFVAILTFGEGWHNNHHAFPRSARCGLKRNEFDLSWLFIVLLKKCGLAHRVHDVKAQAFTTTRPVN